MLKISLRATILNPESWIQLSQWHRGRVGILLKQLVNSETSRAFGEGTFLETYCYSARSKTYYNFTFACWKSRRRGESRRTLGYTRWDRGTFRGDLEDRGSGCFRTQLVIVINIHQRIDGVIKVKEIIEFVAKCCLKGETDLCSVLRN